MDAQRLEALSRLLASGPSRRAVLAGLGVVLGGGAALTRLPAPIAGEEGWVADAEGLNLCRLPSFPCTKRTQCCGGGCEADGTCGCRKRGQSSFIKAACCSGKKKRGNKGVCR